ncbi:phage tail protein [Salmonella enterica]|nr:phage tail protein [Salmonella enterica]
MSKIARYQGNVRAFASDAQGMERTVFGGTNQADDLTSQITASFLRGWGIVGASEHPSLEDFNAAMYAMSQFIAYQHQMGVPEWHAQQEYHLGSICTYNGESYQSLQDANVGSPPQSAKWTPVLTSKNGLANLGLGETAKQAAGALQKSQNGGDIPDKKQFARTIGAVTSTTITFNNASGWYKIATVVMPQATSTAVIKLYGGAGFNVGLFEQAAISELVLRAGNGSPVGITATLWRRSPTSANEVAWVNTSGDTYDIYINIGQHAYWLIAQYDYTGNANVTLYSTPEYSSVQPGNSTSGQTYTLFNSLMKPTYEDVGALPITGGQLNGPLGIGTNNALGGNSIVLGDNDTGFKQDGDGILGIYANNARVGYIDNSGLHLSVDVLTNGGIRAGDGKRLSLTSNNNSTMTATFNLWGDANRPTVIELDDDQGWHLYSQRNPDGSIVFTVNGDITANTLRAGGAIYHNNGDIFGSLWGNDWLSTWINNNLVLDVQLGAGTSVTTWNNAGSWPNTPGYVVTSVWKDNQGENIDGINYAPLQKRVGNQWYTVQGGTV